MFQALHMADVPPQGPVHGAAVRADEDPPVDRGPAGGAGATVCTYWERVAGLGLAEHVGGRLDGGGGHALLTTAVLHSLTEAGCDVWPLRSCPPVNNIYFGHCLFNFTRDASDCSITLWAGLASARLTNCRAHFQILGKDRARHEQTGLSKQTDSFKTRQDRTCPVHSPVPVSKSLIKNGCKIIILVFNF